MSNLNEKKIVLGISGGVDSSTAAILLKEKGFQVTGLFFDIWPLENGGENSPNALRAKELAETIGIDFIYANVAEDFECTVKSNFSQCYLTGKTPNPCIICNPTIKFDQLLKAADKIGAKYVGTGHYARTMEKDGVFYLRMAENQRKDQSYMLYRLPQEVLSRLIFPLGEYESKDEIREIARNNKLQNADTKDSQEICFVSDDQTYIDIISENNKIQKGKFIDKNGKVLGKHEGIVHFTIGQKKGLGIALGKSAFVKEIRPEDNSVVLTFDEKDLFHKKVYIEDAVYPLTNSGVFPKEYNGLEAYAKIRYAAKPSKCILFDGGVEFIEPQRAPSPGQSLVIYKDDLVIGGGFIV